jgi:hypothetical protein
MFKPYTFQDKRDKISVPIYAETPEQGEKGARVILYLYRAAYLADQEDIDNA